MDEQVARTDPAPLRPAPAPAPTPVRARRRWPWLLLLAAAAAAGAALWLHPWSAPAPRRAGPPPETPQAIRTALVETGDLPIRLVGLGTVTPLATVTVRTQISGQLMEVAFTEGQMVKQGDFLVQVDPRPYQAALEQAQGQLAKDQALLKQSELDLGRYQTLLKQDSISRQQAEDQVYLTHQYLGAVQSDQAQIDTQKLNLVYCHITAPVTGRVGLRQVDQGNYVQPTDPNGLVVLTQLQPITVIFTLPEDYLPQIMPHVRAGMKLPVTAFDRSNTTELATGTLATVDNQIDTTTGTVKLRASFANTDESLFPNQFVNASLLVDTLHDAVLVPNPAVQRGAPGTYVYIVTPESTVTVRPIKLGPTDGTRTAVLSGLTAGERVVIDGTDRLREGAKVSVITPPETPARMPKPAK